MLKLSPLERARVISALSHDAEELRRLADQAHAVNGEVLRDIAKESDELIEKIRTAPY